MSRDFARFADAAAFFLEDHCQQVEISKAVLAVAGPVERQRCVLTNCPWIVDQRELYETFRFEARIVNDFEAVAFSLPSLAAADVVAIGGGKPEPGAPMAVLGTGNWTWVRLPGCPGPRSPLSLRARAGTQHWRAPAIVRMQSSGNYAGGSGTCRLNAWFQVMACRISIRRSLRLTRLISRPEAQPTSRKVR